MADKKFRKESKDAVLIVTVDLTASVVITANVESLAQKNQRLVAVQIVNVDLTVHAETTVTVDLHAKK